METVQTNDWQPDYAMIDQMQRKTQQVRPSFYTMNLNDCGAANSHFYRSRKQKKGNRILCRDASTRSINLRLMYCKQRKISSQGKDLLCKQKRRRKQNTAGSSIREWQYSKSESGSIHCGVCHGRETVASCIVIEHAGAGADLPHTHKHKHKAQNANWLLLLLLTRLLAAG